MTRELATGALALFLTLPAHALEGRIAGIDFVAGARLSLGAAVRMQDRDSRLLGKLAVTPDLCPDDCLSFQRDPAPNARLVAAPGSFSGTNEDNGNLNYDQGDLVAVTALAKPSLKLFWRDWQAEFDGLLFFDPVNHDFDETHWDTRWQSESSARPERIERDLALGGRLNKAVITGYLPLGGLGVYLSVGRQLIAWGEATTVALGGLNAINPLDVRMLGVPGSELADLRQAVPLINAESALNEAFSVQAIVQLAWEPATLPPAGSFLSSNDIVGGGDSVTLGLGQYSEDPERRYQPPPLPATITQSSRTARLAPAGRGEPSDGGQFGLRLNYFAEWLNNGTEVAAYYLRFHSRLPVLSALAAERSCLRDAANSSFAAAFAACQGFNGAINPVGIEPLTLDTVQPLLTYPEGIDMLGLSFNTNVGDWALSGELAYRRNQPLQVLATDVLFAALQPSLPEQDIDFGALQQGFVIPAADVAFPSFLPAYRQRDSYAGGEFVPGWERQQLLNASLVGLRIFSRNPLGASSWIFLAELGMTAVLDLPSRSELYFEGAGERTHPSPGSDGTGTPGGEPDPRRINPTQMTGGFADAFSWGYRLVNRLEYNNVLGATVNPALILFHDVGGISPNPVPNFIEGRIQVIGDLQARWDALTAGLRYTAFTGAGTRNRLHDRDFMSAYVAYEF